MVFAGLKNILIRAQKALMAASMTLALASASALAQPGVSEQLLQEISKKYPNARVELTSDLRWFGAEPVGEIVRVRIEQENARGEVYFSVAAATEEGQRNYRGVAVIAAYQPARVAARRILPGEKLKADFFSIQDVNVASGRAREFRGLFFPVDGDVQALETRQTVIEGDFLLSSAVQKTPDVKRGDAVQIRLFSGDLTLSSLGTASEAAYINDTVHVMTQKTKRELVGKLTAGNVVEVRL